MVLVCQKLLFLKVQCELYLLTEIDRIITDEVNLLWTFKSTEHSLYVLTVRGLNSGPFAPMSSALPIGLDLIPAFILNQCIDCFA